MQNDDASPLLPHLLASRPTPEGADFPAASGGFGDRPKLRPDIPDAGPQKRSLILSGPFPRLQIPFMPLSPLSRAKARCSPPGGGPWIPLPKQRQDPRARL